MDADLISRDDTPTLALIRRVLLAILVFGMLGTGIELVLLNHYEDQLQLIPLVLVVTGLGVVAWHAARGSYASVRALQITMAFFVVAGLIGVVLHYRGSLEFQMEVDATQSGWPLFMSVMRAKAPPALAPGVMAQLGLVGLAFSYRHPVVVSSSSSDSDRGKRNVS